MNAPILVRRNGLAWQFLRDGNWSELADESRRLSACEALEAAAARFHLTMIAIISSDLAA